MKTKFLYIIPLILLALIAICFLPPIRNRLSIWSENLRVGVQRAMHPPEQQVFQPRATAPATIHPATIAPTVQIPGSPTPTIQDATPVPTVTPIPFQANLNGVVHEFQQFNNCGPATLSMALSYWGWQGDQRDTRLVLRPSFATIDDKNVNPWEMVAYAQSQPGLTAVSRVGGDLEMLKRLLAAGYPVIIEIGIQHKPKDWMGHYILLSGYDDARQRFTVQDALIGPDQPIGYAEIETGWRAFNQVYLVASPVDRETELQALLGIQADPTANLHFSIEKAKQEITQQSGRERFFARYNLGSSLTALGDYPAAAQAYDEAFTDYAAIPEADRPWRILWYQAGPLEAYFNIGRHEDVLTLGNQALDSAAGPVLEEVFYWLGRAREATGNMDKALYDYRRALEINPASTHARQELERLGQYP